MKSPITPRITHGTAASRSASALDFHISGARGDIRTTGTPITAMATRTTTVTGAIPITVIQVTATDTVDITVMVAAAVPVAMTVGTTGDTTSGAPTRRASTR